MGPTKIVRANDNTIGTEPIMLGMPSFMTAMRRVMTGKTTIMIATNKKAFNLLKKGCCQ